MKPHHALRSVAGIGLATAAVLVLDAATRTRQVQMVLGLIAFGLLLGATRNAAQDDRRLVWTCVGVATVVELFGSVFWGVYRYRLGGVPLYVPPGHGLIYLAGLRLSRSRLFAARPRLTVRLAVAAAFIWALAGLTVLRPDVLGAFFFVYFACFALRTRRGTFFAAIFVLTSLLEITGTALGDWTWAQHAPGISIGVGNPPSVIAGAYCTMDAIVILISRRLNLLAKRSTTGTVSNSFKVAMAVEHALTANRPKIRYVVGRDAKMMLLVKRLLTDRARDALIIRVGKLPRTADQVGERQPSPAEPTATPQRTA